MLPHYMQLERQWRGTGKAVLIRNLGPKWGWLSGSSSDYFIPGKKPRCPFCWVPDTLWTGTKNRTSCLIKLQTPGPSIP